MMPKRDDKALTLRNVKLSRRASADDETLKEMWMTIKILLAIDGSRDALQAVHLALSWVGQGLRAGFVLVNVQDPASLYEMVVAHDVERIAQLRTAAGADLLQPAEALLDAAGQSFESEVAGGTPATLLVELAENYGCQMVLVGARGIGSAERAESAGLGSVAMALLNHSPVPVTVVRAAPAEVGGAGEDRASGDDPQQDAG